MVRGLTKYGDMSGFVGFSDPRFKQQLLYGGYGLKGPAGDLRKSVADRMSLAAHARHPSHVGVWVDVDGGGVLHCINGAGVVFQPIKALKAGGWGHLEFYRHV